ncbi:hypothetical protein [Terriglobus sp. RCC_193]|uniref:bestrophin-like domain n=1 Tax=Terriglobus sp. RCC_193 TaxID=3239218 RepID=UPI003524545B
MIPGSFFIIAIATFALATACGSWVRKKFSATVQREGESLKTLESAILALLGLLLGFTFAMAVSRFDARRGLAIDEANDIGTLWLRTSLLSDGARNAERALIVRYVHTRIEFLAAGRSRERLAQTARNTAQLQNEIWGIAAQEANQRRDATSGLFVSVLNDCIDVTEKRTAALENTIPTAAWAMLLIIGGIGCGLVAVTFQGKVFGLRLLLPLVLACTLAMIYDIDSPRSGLIRVHQQSMERLLQTVQTP